MAWPDASVAGERVQLTGFKVWNWVILQDIEFQAITVMENQMEKDIEQ